MTLILYWVAIFAGALLILLLLISILGGMDIDLDTDTGDVAGDGGGIGLLKGFLTFLAVASWVARMSLSAGQSSFIAALIAVVSGLLAFLILNYLFKYLLRNEEHTNWSMEDALHKNGEVYLKIPKGGEGIVHVEVRGAIRELKARSFDGEEILTGAPIIVVEQDGTALVVRKQ